jgi:hypothetical protein
MRLFTYWLFLAMSSLLTAQTAEDLRSRYGEPNRERFLVRPSIAVTVEYGADRLACRMLIEPPKPLLFEAKQVFMSYDVVTELLEELVPLTSRGNEGLTMLDQFGGSGFRVTNYDNLAIERSTHNCAQLKPDCEERASITFKRYACHGERK